MGVFINASYGSFFYLPGESLTLISNTKERFVGTFFRCSDQFKPTTVGYKERTTNIILVVGIFYRVGPSSLQVYILVVLK